MSRSPFQHVPTASPEYPMSPGLRIVLKRLDDDCLLDGQLHPMIRQRLERIRELPLICVANLIAVQRDANGTGQLVWEYVPGTPLEDFHCDPEQWPRVMREVILAVESLHSAGIVHGAIHARNVIIEPSGAVRLTHLSPLLYSEFEQDSSDVIEMFCRLQSGGEILQELLARARDQNWPLSLLDARLAEWAGGRPPVPREQSEPAPTIRFRSLVAAGLVAAMGILLAWMILWMANHPSFRS